MTLDFLRPAHMDDVLEIVTEPEAVTGASIILRQCVMRGDEILVEASVRVCQRRPGALNSQSVAHRHGLKMVKPSCWAVAERDGLSYQCFSSLKPASNAYASTNLTSGMFLPLARLLRLKECALSTGSMGTASRFVGGWGTNVSQKRTLRRARIGLPGCVKVAVGTTI